MFRLPSPAVLLHLLFALSPLLSSVLAQAEPAPTPPAPAPALRVEVPTFQNPTCPIMGKKVSMPLFVDTDAGRFYICCKPCIKKILADLPAATKTAYPTTKELDNKLCPVSGEPIGDDAVLVALQGYSFRVCCAACVTTARADSQITLTKLLREGVVDIGNTVSPDSGEPVVKNQFVLIGNSLVRLASAKAVEAIEKDPATMLQKAKEQAKQLPPRPKHVHEKKTATPAAPLPGAGK